MTIVGSDIPPITPRYAVVFRGLERKSATRLQHAADRPEGFARRRNMLHHLACDNDVEFPIHVRQKVVSPEFRLDDVRAPRVELQISAAGLNKGSHAATKVKDLETVRWPLHEPACKQHEAKGFGDPTVPVGVLASPIRLIVYRGVVG